MKKIKEKILYVLDVKWHLLFLVALCLNILFFVFLQIEQANELLSSSSLSNIAVVINIIGYIFLFLLIISLLYQLIKKRWIRAFITAIYSASHYYITMFVVLGFVFSSITRSCGEEVNPCKCKDAEQDSYLMDNCKNHIESLTEEENKKWIEEQNDCDSIETQKSVQDGSFIIEQEAEK